MTGRYRSTRHGLQSYLSLPFLQPSFFAGEGSLKIFLMIFLLMIYFINDLVSLTYSITLDLGIQHSDSTFKHYVMFTTKEATICHHTMLV